MEKKKLKSFEDFFIFSLKTESFSSIYSFNIQNNPNKTESQYTFNIFIITIYI